MLPQHLYAKPSHSLANLKWPGIFFFLSIVLSTTQDRRGKNKHLHIPISLYFSSFIPLHNKHTHKIVQDITHRGKPHVTPME